MTTNKVQAFIHLGVHKTGTKFIQQSLFKIQKELERENLELFSLYTMQKFPRNPLRKRLVYNIFREDETRGVDFNTARDWYIAEINNHEYPIVFSDETMLGIHDMCGNKSLYPKSANIANELSNITANSNIKILIYVRRQDKFIESCYMQRINQGTILPFDEYLDSIPLHNLSWQNVIVPFVEKFGIENVIVIPFETIKNGGNSFVKNFLDHIGIDFDISGIDFPQVNSSLSKKAFELAKVVYPLLNNDEKYQFRLYLQTNFPNTKYERLSLLSEYSRKKILDNYQLINAELFHNYIPEISSEIWN